MQYTPRHPNHARAVGNWERKSAYLLREIVKFRTYIDSLTAAQALRERVYAERDRGKSLTEGVEASELVARVAGSGSGSGSGSKSKSEDGGGSESVERSRSGGGSGGDGRGSRGVEERQNTERGRERERENEKEWERGRKMRRDGSEVTGNAEQQGSLSRMERARAASNVSVGMSGTANGVGVGAA